MFQEKVESIIIASLEELSDILDEKIEDPINSHTKIFGKNSALDSMSLVTLIADIEDKIEQEFGTLLVLADDRAMSQKKSPFRSISSLTQYVCMLLEELSTK